MNKFDKLPAKMFLDLISVREHIKEAEKNKLTISMGVNFPDLAQRTVSCFSKNENKAIVNVVQMNDDGAPVCEFPSGLLHKHWVAVPSDCLSPVTTRGPQTEKPSSVKTVEIKGCSVVSFG